jgi:hypothetical protein
MEADLTKEEAILRAMLLSEAEERAKWIGLEEAIQSSSSPPHWHRHLHSQHLSSCLLHLRGPMCGRHRRSSSTSARRTRSHWQEGLEASIGVIFLFFKLLNSPFVGPSIYANYVVILIHFSGFKPLGSLPLANGPQFFFFQRATAFRPKQTKKRLVLLVAVEDNLKSLFF